MLPRRFGLLLWGAFVFCLFASVVLVVEAGRDYYKILNVDRQASQAQIKRAYKQLSKQLHPDKNPNDDKAHEKFSELTEAYKVLSDEKTRSLYDQGGEEAVKQGDQGFSGQDPFDIFAQFFGGGGGFFGGRESRYEKEEVRGPTIHLPLQVSLAEVYVGTTLDYEVSKQIHCDKCHGSGAENPDDVETCDSCRGKGVKMVQQMLAPGFIQTMQTTCNVCHGTGKVIHHKCSQCGGSKVQRDNELLAVVVTPGMPDNHAIRFEREGDHSPDWDVPGDLVFHLKTLPHPAFTRDGHDLHLNFTISLVQALSGFETTFLHLDKKTKVLLKRESVTPPGFIQKVQGQGMPMYNPDTDSASGHGDLFVHYTVEFPQSVTDKQKDTLKGMFSIQPKKPTVLLHHDEL
ncbi:DnaJ- protein scj1 [Dispira parvispora]|uniref:DnaJ- protein scj1 n=1 Tax=Dispira parvispora TaxID=1520584 RepID=A0A9W8E3T1_9FUNG|nr:DnaJ- protein scj1 [Dispira parvispora]